MVSLDVFTSKTEGRIVGTKALCVRDHLNASTFISGITEDKSWIPDGEGLKVLIVQGNILPLQRNECLKQMEGDWILFIDDDMVYRPEHIRDLVLSWLELQEKFEEPVILGGLCNRRAAPHDPTLYRIASPKMTRYRLLESWINPVVEVDATGLAFLLIGINTLEAMTGTEWPNFETRSIYQPPELFRWKDGLGEDLRFCQDAKAAGCRIFVDTRIEIGHVAEKTVGMRDWYQHMALRSSEEEDFSRRVNNKYGLPTLTSKEARERLGW